MDKREMRQVALGAARGQLRRLGVALDSVTMQDVAAVLDDLSRRDSGLVAAQWYVAASDAQVTRLAADIRAQARTMARHAGVTTDDGRDREGGVAR